MTTKTTDTATKDRTKPSAKDEVRALLDRLPHGVTLQDIQYHEEVKRLENVPGSFEEWAQEPCQAA
jgi:hypothetical protein